MRISRLTIILLAFLWGFSLPIYPQDIGGVYGPARVLALGASNPSYALTVGTMSVSNSAELRVTVHRFDWTNAMVSSLGAVLTGNVAVCTLPAKTVILGAYVVITGTASGNTTLTVSVGRTGASYIDYIVAKNAMAATSTVYGAVSGDRGTNLTGYDLPSWTAPTLVNANFTSTGTNLSATLGSTGSVYLITGALP